MVLQVVGGALLSVLGVLNLFNLLQSMYILSKHCAVTQFPFCLAVFIIILSSYFQADIYISQVKE